MELPRPSDEQNAIIQQVLSEKNMIVIAVAGAGKTTNMLQIARVLNAGTVRKRILILTYNARLKDETRAKIQALGLSNTEAHSYHAFGVKHYISACNTDSGILRTVRDNIRPCRQFWFDLIIVDEVQDMTSLYCKFVKKILRDCVWVGPSESVEPVDYSDEPILEPSGLIHGPEKEPTENTFGDSDEESPPAPVSVITEPSPVSTAVETGENDDFDFTSTAPTGSIRSIPVSPTPVVLPVSPVLTGTLVEPGAARRQQLCVFGDPEQNIYAFKDADDRFLTMADRVFATCPTIQENAWTKMPLAQSFRITAPMAAFVNRVCLGYDKVRSTKRGSRVRYLICNSFGRDPTGALLALLNSGYTAADVFVIAPSVRSTTNPIRNLERNMVSMGYPCFVPVGDDEALKPEVVRNKMVLCSIHQTKGLERRIVMMFGFDISYFKFFNRDADPAICPNEIYVAVTRAKEHLILVHDQKHHYMPFLDQIALAEVCDVQMPAKFDPQTRDVPDRSKFGVTELTRHLTLETMNELLASLCWVELDQQSRKHLIRPGFDFNLSVPIGMMQTVPGTAGEESVSDVNGICLPAIYEYKTAKRVSIASFVEENLSRIPKQDQARALELCRKFVRLAGSSYDLSDFLQLSTIYSSMQSGYIFKIRQIVRFDWLKQEDVEKALGIVRKYIPPNASYEVDLTQSMVVKGANRIVSGRLDALVLISRSVDINGPGKVCPDSIVQVWEFKCVGKLSSEHILQLAEYAWLFHKTYPMTRANFYLLNILDDSLIEIIVSPYHDVMDDIMLRLITEKVKSKKRDTDEQFLSLNSI